MQLARTALRFRSSQGRRADCAHNDPGVQVTPAEQEIAEQSACEDSGDRAAANQQQQQVRERRPDAVLLLGELAPEGLQAGEEEVAAGARHDQADVRRNSQQVGRCGEQAQMLWVIGENERRIRLDATRCRDPAPSMRQSVSRSAKPGSTALPPRFGSGTLKTAHDSNKAGIARLANAARQERMAMSPVTANPIPAPKSSPARMYP